MTAESQALFRYLENQRLHVLGILEGLSEHDLHRPVLPTGWNCIGMVQHLALDVERFWFRTIVAGEAVERPPDLAPNDLVAAWKVSPGTSSTVVFDLYRAEIERANSIITATSLDTPPAWWPDDRWKGWKLADLRTIMLHVIAETACHAGHLDAAREIIDDRTWSTIAS